MKTERKKPFFTRNLLTALRFIKESRYYIYFSVVIFVFFAIFGALFPIPGFVEQELLKIIQELIKKTEGMDFFQITWYIFWNNTKVSLFAILSGIFLGFIPAIGAMFNGYLIGFISSKSASQEGIFILWRL
ncbi:MAG: stage II sporulation protein M, partial [Nanoarchaeota archaeon]